MQKVLKETVPNEVPKDTAYFFSFTEEIFDEKLHC